MPKGTSDLDECGGRLDEDTYAYYFTDHWPYSLRCFRGTPMQAKISAIPIFVLGSCFEGYRKLVVTE